MEKFCNLAFLEQQLEEHNRNEQDKVEVCTVKSFKCIMFLIKTHGICYFVYKEGDG